MSGLPLKDCELAQRLLHGQSLDEIAAVDGVSASCMRERVAGLLDRLRATPAPAVRRTPPDTAGSPNEDD
ncbi:hypothetical protein SAMN05216241_10885 [Limimonas halophila]|uniref:Sigma-70, region 4 n=1 Tax=Limimonas halophila TaxID=1082479 RepID=A0A1G7T430_9PROT|nr:hypothetical protein [Limimonas halophila]SDG30117.1 hypothetical protein SAMN05216241_10885 [Limimonas halophila]